MWKNIVERGRPQMAIWRMRVACWVPKVAETHSEYVTLTACPQQQWSHERISVLGYTHIACLAHHHVDCTFPQSLNPLVFCYAGRPADRPTLLDCSHRTALPLQLAALSSSRSLSHIPHIYALDLIKFGLQFNAISFSFVPS